MSTAAEYLESLQRSSGMDRTRAAKRLEVYEASLAEPDFEEFILGMAAGNDEEATRRHESVMERFREAERVKPTPYEDPGNYTLMLGLAKRLKPVVQRIFSDPPEMPLFGTLPIGQLNAMAIRVPPGNDYLIVFQEGVFGFANLLTKAVAASLPTQEDDAGGLKFSLDRDQIESGWDKDDRPLRRLDDLLSAYLIAGHPHAAEQYFIDPPQSQLSRVLLHAFEIFIFGHEFGHVVRGHLDTESPRPTSLGLTEFEELSPDWKMEFEADFVGLVLTMHVLNEDGFDPATSYWGVDLAFGAMQLLDQARSTLVSGSPAQSPPSASHPPPSERREASRMGLNLVFGEDGAKNATGLASISEELVDAMWERIRPSFEERHDQGLRPLSVWQR